MSTILKPSQRKPLFDESDVAAVAVAVQSINGLIQKTRQTETVDVTSVVSKLSGSQRRHLVGLLKQAQWTLVHTTFRNEDAWTLKEGE